MRKYILIPKSCTLRIVVFLMMLCIGFLYMAFLFINNVYSYLALNRPADSEYLLIEGWVSDYVFREGLNEFRKNPYISIIVTGDSVEKGPYYSDSKTYAEWAGKLLQDYGLSRDSIIVISTPNVNRDRTYASALAVKQWINTSELRVSSINIMTSSVHARRTYKTYKFVFKDKVDIGILSIRNKNISIDKWWYTSYGFKSVIYECIGLLYFYIIFVPTQ